MLRGGRSGTPWLLEVGLRDGQWDAAVKESRYFGTLGWRVQFEIVVMCLLLRWADDNLQIWDRSVSRDTKPRCYGFLSFRAPA